MNKLDLNEIETVDVNRTKGASWAFIISWLVALLVIIFS